MIVSENQIQEIPENSFANFSLKDFLILKKNKIQTIKSLAFENFSFEALDFSQNQTQNVEKNSFKNGKIAGGPKLFEPLNFTGNKLKEIPINGFTNVFISALIFDQNQISTIPKKMMETFPGLNLFRIQSNPIEKIETDAFFNANLGEFTLISEKSFEIENRAINGSKFLEFMDFSYSRLLFAKS